MTEFNKGGKRKSFWRVARKLVEAKVAGVPIQGLTVGGVHHFDLPSRSKITAEYLKTLYAFKEKPTQWNFGLEPIPVSLFSNDDLLKAWEAHNSNKAIGSDLFDMKVIKSLRLK